MNNNNFIMSFQSDVTDVPYAAGALESSGGTSEPVTNQNNLATTSYVEQSALAAVPYQSVVNDNSYSISDTLAASKLYDKKAALATATIIAACSKLTELAETALRNANNSPTSFVDWLESVCSVITATNSAYAGYINSLSVAVKSVNAIYQITPSVEAASVELIDSASEAPSAALYKPPPLVAFVTINMLQLTI